MRKPSISSSVLSIGISSIETIQWHARLFCQCASCSELLVCIWKSNISIGRFEYNNSIPISSKCLTQICSNSVIPLPTHQVPLHRYWMTWLLGMTKNWHDFWFAGCMCAPLKSCKSYFVSKAKLDACPLPMFVSYTSNFEPLRICVQNAEVVLQLMTLERKNSNTY